MSRPRIITFLAIVGFLAFVGHASADFSIVSYSGGESVSMQSGVFEALTLKHACGALGALFLGLAAIRRLGHSDSRDWS